MDSKKNEFHWISLNLSFIDNERIKRELTYLDFVQIWAGNIFFTWIEGKYQATFSLIYVMQVNEITKKR